MFTALALAGGVVAVPAKPASAAVDLATIIKVYGYVQKAYGYWKSLQGFLNSGGSSGLSLEQATQAIISEIQTSRNEIVSHMTSIATADVRACAVHHVIEFADIERFNDQILQQWAQDATSCVTRISTLYTSLPANSYAAWNDLGAALGVVGPIALIARTRAGFGTAGLTDLLVQAFQRVAATFPVSCGIVPEGFNYSDEQWPTYPIYISTVYTCTSAGFFQIPYAGVSWWGYAWWQIHVYLDQNCRCASSHPDYSNIDGQNLIAATEAKTARGIALDALAKLRSP
ncbi:hypothetical protein ABZ738_22250 [Micromonospora sp. NPDC047793]|uniref:hypothetical protein n=1 Tax=unclassified Micromonospora TaxID=2617518 RepID=UPI003406FE42